MQNGNPCLPLSPPHTQSQKRHPDGVQQFNPLHYSTPPPPPYFPTSLHTSHDDELTHSLSDFQQLARKTKTMPTHRPLSPYIRHQRPGTSTRVPHPPSSPHDELTHSLSDFQQLARKTKTMPTHRPPSPYIRDQRPGTSTRVPHPPSSPKPRTPMNITGRRSTVRGRRPSVSLESDAQ